MVSTDNVPEGEEPEGVSKVPSNDDPMSDFDDDERAYADKASLYGRRTRLSLICWTFSVGLLTERLMRRPEGRGKGLVERYAQGEGVTPWVLYKAKELVDRVPDPVIQQFFKAAESSPDRERRISLEHVKAIAYAEGPDEASERAAWFIDQLKRIASERLSPKVTKEKLRSATDANAVEDSKETEGDAAGGSKADGTSLPEGSKTEESVPSVPAILKDLRAELTGPEPAWVARLKIGAEQCKKSQIAKAIRALEDTREWYLKRHDRWIEALETARRILTERQDT